MIAKNKLRVASGLLISVAVTGVTRAQTSGSVPPPPPPGRVASPPLDGPVADLEPIRSDDPTVRDSRGAEQDTGASPASHDALQGKSVKPLTERVHAPQQPPRPIAERPSGRRPDRRATWVPGYWDWDPARAEFVWIGGVWQIPPPGSMWVTARWLRDQDGWYRSSGFWTRGRDSRDRDDVLGPSAARMENERPPLKPSR